MRCISRVMNVTLLLHQSGVSWPGVQQWHYTVTIKCDLSTGCWGVRALMKTCCTPTGHACAQQRNPPPSGVNFDLLYLLDGYYNPDKPTCLRIHAASRHYPF